MNPRFPALAASFALLGAAPATGDDAGGPMSAAWPPQSLSESGLFVDGSTTQVRPGVLPFSPQYPLWSDGAAKRRWVSFPMGAAIDASRADAWQFPAGTRFWKEFSVDGRRIETRMIERLPDRSWVFAAYAWNESQTEAMLVPADDRQTLVLPNGRRYSIPSEADCRACHEGAAVPVLGFSALQLSSDRDPLAPHAVPAPSGGLDLPALIAGDLLRGLPGELARTPPRIAAPTPAWRAVLGYLHANCGHCHVSPELSGAAVPVELQLAIDPADPAAAQQAIARLVDGTSRYRPGVAADARYVVPGQSALGMLLARMRSREPRSQMPPLGSAAPDREAIALLERWIDQDLNHAKETTP